MSNLPDVLSADLCVALSFAIRVSRTRLVAVGIVFTDNADGISQQAKLLVMCIAPDTRCLSLPPTAPRRWPSSSPTSTLPTPQWTPPQARPSVVALAMPDATTETQLRLPA